MQILPNDSAKYEYVIYPLQSGFCKLPKFNIKLNNADLLKPNTAGVKESPSNQVTFSVTSVDGVSSDASSTSLGNKSDGGLDGQVTTAGLEHIVQNMIPSQIFIMPHGESKKKS